MTPRSNSHDLLLLPTTVIEATQFPTGCEPAGDHAAKLEGTRNTCPFNVTGHPAISIPCGMEDGRPIGLMLVGRHWDERTIYRAAKRSRGSGDWMKFLALGALLSPQRHWAGGIEARDGRR